MQKLFILFCLALAMPGCSSFEPAAPAEDTILDGPVQGLSTADHARFLAGDRAFNDRVFTAETGLGPLFVASSCGTCHAGDGKGHPFTTLIRYGQTDSTGNAYLSSGGPQLQHLAIPGFTPETLPPGTTFSSFTPPAVTGLGFFEAVSDQDILAMSDPYDTNGDGISGRPNWIELPAYVQTRDHAVTHNGKYIGRFGKKAAVYDLLQQTAGAFNQDMGITSTFEARDPYTGHSTDPEVEDQSVRDIVFYLQTLKAPIARNQDDPTVIAGKAVFINIGCEACHRQTLQTWKSDVDALSFQQFSPYTDLLLHDMGDALDDGYTEGNATSGEWRTPPLWGLGLSANSQGGEYYLMHDGRARSIDQAILLHAGEAESSRMLYQSLSSDDQKALLTFLEAL